MTEEAIYQRGSQLGLKFAAAGLGIALAFTGLTGILSAFLREYPWVVIGAVAMVLYCGWLGGGLAARHVYQGGGAMVSGFGAAVFAVAAPTLALSLPFALAARSLEQFWLILFGPLYVILLYGGVPLTILGVIFGLMLGNQAQRYR